MNQMTHRPSIEAPQLRTLLLTDLCDSTTLVERIGDVEAATLFRDHDRLVLDLQQRWRGRLIDRSDGLLLLFERPIDGLGFALDYVRGLSEMGRTRRLDLKARAGLHVGEVLTWRNSDEAVSVGAKPLEVEGLAKPMAARLMAMARPGQILLSAIAEPLAHRAARELGERGQHLLWKSHGRWRFKGLPDSQQIYEVGEPGVAPLRTPPNTPKAWRDIPLWRRPAALAAEAAVIAGVCVGVWFATRPAPAIAFNQRDWVVVADLRNLTGQRVLDDSLEQAFRISLEQSRYVNVLSDLKAHATLARMQRGPGAALDRAAASEVALRDGARAVIVPTIAEVGGRLRFSAEVVDPNTQATIYSEFADGAGSASILSSVDEVTGELRGRLGEALASVNATSVPLPQVTTSNLDALRAYALAEQAFVRGTYDEALSLYRRAGELDPQFALAWVGQMRTRYAQSDNDEAVKLLRRAQALRQHLPPREALYLDAWAARFDAPAAGPAKWRELARLYPDYAQAQTNAALWLLVSNRFTDALSFAQHAMKLPDATMPVATDAAGRALLGLEQYKQAAVVFDQAFDRGYRSSLRRRMGAEAAGGDFAAASALEKQLRADDRYSYFERISLAIDTARWSDADRYARTALDLVGKDDGFDSRNFPLLVGTTSWLNGDAAVAREQARTSVERALARLDASFDPDGEDDAAVALAGAIFSLRMGDTHLAKRTVAALEKLETLMDIPGLRELHTVVRAELLRLDGRPKEAIALLQPLLTGQEYFQTRRALRDAYADAGDWQAALEQSRWLRDRRGRAYTEQLCGYCAQALNVADSNIAMLSEAEILLELGRTGEAAQALARFDRKWPVEALPGHLRVRRSKVPLSNVGV